MALLGLDISTAAGFAVETNARTFAWTWTARVDRPKDLKPHDIHAAYHGEIGFQFATELRRAIEEFRVTVVGIEKPIPPNGFGGKDEVTNPAGFGGMQVKKARRSAPTSFNVSYLQLGLPMLAAMVCRERGVRVQFISVGTWRSTFLGCVKAPEDVVGDAKRRKWLKDLCIQRCEREGVHVDTDNAADAVGVVRGLSKKVRAAQGADRHAGEAARKAALANAQELFRHG